MVLLACQSLFFLPFSKTLSEAGWILAIGLWLFWQIKKKEPFFERNFLNGVYLLFLIVVFVSLTQCRDGEFLSVGLRGAWKWSKYLALFLMVRNLFKETKAVKLAAHFFLASMALVSLNGLWQMWSGLDLVHGYAVDIPGRLVRMRSSFGSPNDLAAFYLVALPLAFQMWLNEKHWSLRSVLLAGLAAVFFMCLVLTFSRSAFLALCAALFIFLMGEGRKKVILICVVFLAIFLGFSGLLRENFVTSLNPKDITVGERLHTWGRSLELIKEKPLLGHGANTYYRELAAHAPAGEEYRGYAHNFILQLWSDVGLAGLGLFLFGLVYGFVKKWPGRQEDLKLPEFTAALWVGLLAFILQGLLDTNFFAFQTTHLFWFFWAVLLAPARPVGGERRNVSL